MLSLGGGSRNYCYLMHSVIYVSLRPHFPLELFTFNRQWFRCVWSTSAADGGRIVLFMKKALSAECVFKESIFLMLFPFTIIVLIFLHVFSIQGLYTVVLCYFNSGLIISHEIRLLGVGSFGRLVKNITCQTLGNPPREADPDGFSYLGVHRQI